MASPSGRTHGAAHPRQLPRRPERCLEFFLSSHGSRKSLADTALRTADSGYLTRRLVDVSQEVIVREQDCFEARGEKVRGIDGAGHQRSAIRSSRAWKTVWWAAWPPRMWCDPETGEVLVALNETDYQRQGQAGSVKAGITKVHGPQRADLPVHEHGVCARCYGTNLATGGAVDVGEAVGIIAAQSIGEPGTQLTMRTFHTGGIASRRGHHAGSSPRRGTVSRPASPKRDAILTEISGRVTLRREQEEARSDRHQRGRSPSESKTYAINYGSRLKVQEGRAWWKPATS